VVASPSERIGRMARKAADFVSAALFAAAMICYLDGTSQGMLKKGVV
jgi:hypothetical protein